MGQRGAPELVNAATAGGIAAVLGICHGVAGGEALLGMCDMMVPDGIQDAVPSLQAAKQVLCPPFLLLCSLCHLPLSQQLIHSFTNRKRRLGVRRRGVR